MFTQISFAKMQNWDPVWVLEDCEVQFIQHILMNWRDFLRPYHITLVPKFALSFLFFSNGLVTLVRCYCKYHQSKAEDYYIVSFLTFIIICAYPTYHGKARKYNGLTEGLVYPKKRSSKIHSIQYHHIFHCTGDVQIKETKEQTNKQFFLFEI